MKADTTKLLNHPHQSPLYFVGEDVLIEGIRGCNDNKNRTDHY